MDNLKEKINYLRNFEPIQVDAGYVDFLPNGLIRVSRNSDTLDLPVQRFANEAREVTVKCFQEQSPNHKVVPGKERY